jgi:hypothetical protein
MSFEAAIAALGAIVLLLSILALIRARRTAVRQVEGFMATLAILVEHRTDADMSDSGVPHRR